MQISKEDYVLHSSLFQYLSQLRESMVKPHESKVFICIFETHTHTHTRLFQMAKVLWSWAAWPQVIRSRRKQNDVFIPYQRREKRGGGLKWKVGNAGVRNRGMQEGGLTRQNENGWRTMKWPGGGSEEEVCLSIGLGADHSAEDRSDPKPGGSHSPLHARTHARMHSVPLPNAAAWR